MKVEKCCGYYPTLKGGDRALYEKGVLGRIVLNEPFTVLVLRDFDDREGQQIFDDNESHYWELSCISCDKFFSIPRGAFYSGEHTPREYLIESWNELVKDTDKIEIKKCCDAYPVIEIFPLEGPGFSRLTLGCANKACRQSQWKTYFLSKQGFTINIDELLGSSKG